MLRDDFWSEDHILVDLLFETNLSHKEIAKELSWTEYRVGQRIKELGIGWIRRKDRKLSRGQAALQAIMQRLIPNEAILAEYPIGERLRLDVYCPRLKIAAEYHGRQHFYYVEHFHGDASGFEESKKRDMRKEQLCKDEGISLVVFRYNDDLTEDVVFSRLMDALGQATPHQKPEPKPSRYKGNPYYEAQKVRQRERNRQQYKEMKLRKRK